MHQTDMTFYIHAPRAKVFEAVSDHQNFFRGGSIESTRVTTPGVTERNGLGSIREVRAGRVRLKEEITLFERPSRLDYLVIQSTLPIEHEGGQLHFIERGEGTEIHWRTRFRLRVLWGMADPSELMGMALVNQVTGLIQELKGRLETDDNRDD